MAEVQDQGRERARRIAILLTGGIVLAVAASLVTAGLLVRDKPAGPSSGDKDLQVVEYQTPSAAGDDPFTTAADVEGDKVVRFKPAGGSTDAGGSEPFGGSGSLHVCDREKLVDFLLSHKAERKAWAGVLKIDSDKDSVSRYVRSLTPVTLTVDTRVTNHMFVNGRAVPFQSILAAGTAVLVDKYGRPVVRCKCGNPLWWPKDYPRVTCHHCPPHYHPPKACKWRTYDPWYGYPPEWLPPEWRDPYPKNYPKPKPWVYKKGDYCYLVYPDPPEVDYPPRWYPPGSTYQPPKYYPKPTYRPQAPPPSDQSDESDQSDSSDSSDGAGGGCCGGGMDHTDSSSDTDSDMQQHPF
ncbi:MAG TPA: DUF6777 domain-containing protein [Aeromicrobium sp.]|nr:DUF6777 domain-containing protein [Aeromicrobium sp.]